MIKSLVGVANCFDTVILIPFQHYFSKQQDGTVIMEGYNRTPFMIKNKPTGIEPRPLA